MAAKQKTIEQLAQAKYKSTYAKPWAERIAEAPQCRQLLLELCRAECELDYISEKLDKEEREGKDTFTVVLENGQHAIRPDRKHQKDLRNQLKNLGKILNLDMSRKDRNRTGESRFEKLLKSGANE